MAKSTHNNQAQAPAQASAQSAPALTTVEIAAKVAAMLNATMPLASVHNAILQAVKLANETAPADATLVTALGGHACAGWRKPALQHIASAFGLVPCLVMAPPAAGKPAGQQASFYGNGTAASIAASLYSTMFTYVNVNGNKLLRDARVEGHNAGKTGKAGDRLQQNVYNDFALQVLSQLESAPAQPVADTVKAGFAEKYSTKPSKGGLVLSGTYVASAYDGSLPIIATK